MLNRITHGAVRRRLLWLVLGHWLRGTRILVVDTPLAVEAGLWRFCGEMVLVYWWVWRAAVTPTPTLLVLLLLMPLSLSVVFFQLQRGPAGTHAQA